MIQITDSNTPADPTIQFTGLKLGSKTYQLCFDFDAIARAEEITGMPLMAGVDFSAVGVKRLRAMLFASALKAQPEVTLQEFTRFINPVNVPKIERALVAAWIASVKEEEEQTETENASAQNASAQNPTQPADAN